MKFRRGKGGKVFFRLWSFPRQDISRNVVLWDIFVHDVINLSYLVIEFQSKDSLNFSLQYIVKLLTLGKNRIRGYFSLEAAIGHCYKKNLDLREWSLILGNGAQRIFKIYQKILVTMFISPEVLETRYKSSPGFRDPDLGLHILAKFFITYYLVF